jgi:hypothetical protein
MDNNHNSGASGTPEGPARRMIHRRNRGGGGFSASISTRSESLREPARNPSHEVDEVDDIVDVESVSNNIRAGTLSPPPPPPAQPARPPRDNPRSRLDQVAMAGSATYAKEFRLRLLHRLLMRNIPLDEIARQLKVSISTVEKDRAELKKRLREAATQLDINEIVGGQGEFYDEVAGMALRVASAGAERDENGNPVQAVPTAMRLAAMRTALAANADKNRFYASAGVYDVLKFRRAENGTGLSDVQMLMMQTMEMMQQLDEDAAPPPPRPAGFKGMSFDDAGASSADHEVQEL